MTNGRIIGVSNTPTLEQASGVWDIDDVLIAKNTNTWPRAVPSVVLNAAVWFDAADLTTITEASGAVFQWNNKGSLGNVSQGTAAVQPTTGATTVNGLNVIDFAGDYLTSVDASSVYKFMNDGTTWLMAGVFKHAGATKGFFGNSRGTTAATGVDYRSFSTGTQLVINVMDSSGSTTTTPVRDVISITENTFRIDSLICDPDNGTAADRLSWFINDGADAATQTNTGTVDTGNPTYVLQIGALGDNNGPLDGSIAELVIVSGADATEGNRTIIRDYLNKKWGIY